MDARKTTKQERKRYPNMDYVLEFGTRELFFTVKSIQELQQILRNLLEESEAPTQGWIKMDNRLPEKWMDVIFTDGKHYEIGSISPVYEAPINDDAERLDFEPTHWLQYRTM